MCLLRAWNTNTNTNHAIYTFKAEKSQSTKLIVHVNMKHDTSTVTGNGQTMPGKYLLYFEVCAKGI